jgi:hypothetical protein
MKVLRTNDIITLKHEELEVDFSPLRYDRSIEIANTTRNEAGNSIVDVTKQTSLMIKYAVKELRGLTDYDNNPIQVKAVNGELSDDDVSTAINVLVKTPFLAPISFISTSGTPRQYEGVEIMVNGKVLDLGK